MTWSLCSNWLLTPTSRLLQLTSNHQIWRGNTYGACIWVVSHTPTP